MRGARIGAISGILFLVALGGIVFNALGPAQGGAGLIEGPGEALMATVAVVVLGGLVVVAIFALAGALTGALVETLRKPAPPPSRR